MDLHAIIEDGSVDALRAAIDGGADVEALDGGRTPLMSAAEAGALDKMRLLLAAGARPDRVVRGWTALHEAADEGFADGAALLLSLGAEHGLRAPGERAHLRSGGQVPLPTLEPAIGHARSPAVLRLLLAAGEEAGDVDRDVLLELLGGRYREPLGQAADSYARDFAARRGTANPERIRSAFWDEMIDTGWNAYRARDTYGVPEPTAIWCHDRLGRSLTALPDGRLVGIAGEHEDYYDPDFYVYSDVIVYHPDGTHDIYGYPADVFPPTDFQSASLVGEWVYIIGNFGYPRARRAGHTPVYRLRLSDMSIQAVETRGPMPGWLGKHRALHLPEHGAIYVWGGKTLAGPPRTCGSRLLLGEMRWEPVSWLPGEGGA